MDKKLLVTVLVLVFAGCAQAGPETVRMACADPARPFATAERPETILIACPERERPAAASETAIGRSAEDIDWSQAPRAQLVLQAAAVAPPALEFQQGRPARLQLRNIGPVRQTLNANSFFASAVCSMLITVPRPLPLPANPITPSLSVRRPPREVLLDGVPCPSAIHLEPGQVTEVYFVPREAGYYDISCVPCGTASFATASRIKVTD